MCLGRGISHTDKARFYQNPFPSLQPWYTSSDFSSNFPVPPALRQPVRLYISAHFPSFFSFLPFFFFSDGPFGNPDCPPFGEGQNSYNFNCILYQTSPFGTHPHHFTPGTPGLRDKRPFFHLYTTITTFKTFRHHTYFFNLSLGRPIRCHRRRPRSIPSRPSRGRTHRRQIRPFGCRTRHPAAQANDNPRVYQGPPIPKTNVG
jgi:hypothetical protein